ncbi:MAG: hypothetical protein U5R48_06535 [Gammaproteobacteria bacterium]|nr:hypothetical protein [Gammaproteobacteria bacterium]
MPCCGRTGTGSGGPRAPHLLRFNERIVLDDREFADADIVAAFERIEAARTAEPAVSLTYFEFAILAALDLLARGAPELAILEVGLGGRLDAVNIIDADLAVITAVDLDHQSWLGDDRETIGAEKAGILRPGRPVVIGDRDPPGSVTAAARSLEAPAQCIGRDFDLRPDADGWVFHGRDRSGAGVQLQRLPAPRLHPDAVATALQAALTLGLEPDRERVARVLEVQQLAGRMQRLRRGGVELLLDVAHNPHASRALAERLACRRRGTRPGVQALFGTLADKDAPAMLEPLRDCGIEALRSRWTRRALAAARGRLSRPRSCPPVPGRRIRVAPSRPHSNRPARPHVPGRARCSCIGFLDRGGRRARAAAAAESASDEHTRNRVVGGLILVSLAAIFLPMLLDGEGLERREVPRMPVGERAAPRGRDHRSGGRGRPSSRTPGVSASGPNPWTGAPCMCPRPPVPAPETGRRPARPRHPAATRNPAPRAGTSRPRRPDPHSTRPWAATGCRSRGASSWRPSPPGTMPRARASDCSMTATRRI